MELIYEEPTPLQLLILCSFFFLLPVIGAITDRLLYCGLISQIALGVAFGASAGKILEEEWQRTLTAVGFMGLILVVFEGGLNTCLVDIRANLKTSIFVALTGITVPIALSFIMCAFGETPLEAFASGSALSSTSLGTTLSLMASAKLFDSTSGIVLTSAAVIDDVVGLILMAVIQNLGVGKTVSAMTILRPIIASIGMTLAAVICILLLQPIYAYFYFTTKVRSSVLVVLISLLIIGFITAASYAGSSSLYGAYLAGSIVGTVARQFGAEIWEKYFSKTVRYFLLPLFFATIGFILPTNILFKPSLVWRGIIYAGLMTLGKIITGMWLVNWRTYVFKGDPANEEIHKSYHVDDNFEMVEITISERKSQLTAASPPLDIRSSGNENPNAPVSETLHYTRRSEVGGSELVDSPTGNEDMEKSSSSTSQSYNAQSSVSPDINAQLALGISASPETLVNLLPWSQRRKNNLYSSFMVGCAMVARGEIGFIIAASAHVNGVLGDVAYGTALWAVVLGTLFGSLSVGVLVTVGQRRGLHFD